MASFTRKLSKMLNRMLHTQPKYISSSVRIGESMQHHLPSHHMPGHVAIIMDGNGRWAEKRSLPRSAGHAAGTEALREIIRASDEWGIRILSLYAFSTENWSRSKEEVGALMSLLLKYFSSEIDELHKKNVRIRILGDVEGLPEAQKNAVCKAMERTKDNTGLQLNIALNYGGRAELIFAAQRLARMAASGEIAPEAIDAAAFEEGLFTAGQDDVDLLIRTSGEKRTSNFLPWQTAYAEMIFNPVLWPDYDRVHYLNDLREYAARDRRFGGVKAQAPAETEAKA